MEPDNVKLYDTTLRDGMQGQGVSLSAREKVRVVHALDRLGIDLIEAGFPGSNPKEIELFDLLAEEDLTDARICAFGMTRRRDVAAEDDPGLAALVASRAPVVTLVGKTWSLHLEKVTRVGRDENLAMIADSVAWCCSHDREVIYDAEHFFDAWRDDPGYATACLEAAIEAGASNLTLCDTNGSSLPGEIAEATAGVASRLDGHSQIGIHPHNDLECGVANAIAAVGAGARLVQGTMNGLGERCGNANLTSILPLLKLKLGFDCVTDEQLALLTETSHFVDELLNLAPDPDQPFVGRNAFAHKGGMHVAAVQADARTFEHLDPVLIGNRREVLVSELSGKGSVMSRAAELGLELDEASAQRAVEEVKRREHLGYHYEAADASFELLLRREAGRYEPLFTLEGFRVITEKREGGRVETEATIKIWAEGARHVCTAEGNGPVNALDRALRSAIGRLHPHLAEIELVGYKVRILDSDHGTGAVTRVLIDSTDGESTWGALGVSENIIEASWEALVDSLEHAFQPRDEPAEQDSGAPASARG